MAFSFVFLILFVVVGVRSGAFEMAARMASRVFVSGRRREAPVVSRGGGVGGLPADLAGLVERGRELEAAVDALRELSPRYHRSQNALSSTLLVDRRRYALRRDFEDAVVHVAAALRAWAGARAQLGERSRLLLRGQPNPDIEGVLDRFAWLPRSVIECGPLHFRSDLVALERALGRVHSALGELEHGLVYGHRPAYR